MTNSELPNVLVVDHNNINLDLISSVFNKHQISINFDLTQSIPELLEKLEQQSWQAIFLMIDNVPISIDALMEAMPVINTNCPLIAIPQEYDREQALAFIHSGAKEVFSVEETEYLAAFIKQLLSDNALSETVKNQQQILKEVEEKFNSLYSQLPMAVTYIHEGVFIDSNPAFRTFFSINEDEETDEISFLDLVAYEDLDKAKRLLQQVVSNCDQPVKTETIQVKTSADSTSQVTLIISKITINGEPSLQIIFQPTQWEIKTQASSNTSQDMLSPDFFVQILNQIIRKTNTNKAHCLCFFELDGYSRIKHNIGITRSDHLLHEISDFMRQQISNDLKISRLNSDVYTLIFSDDTPSGCIQKIEALQAAFNEYSFSSIDQSIKVASNIGVVHLTSLVHSPDQALSLADVACTVSRNRKKNQLHIYNPEEDRSTVESIDQSWVDKIKDAIEHDNFKLLFQPIVSLGTEMQEIYEVLLRIKRSGGDDVLPNQFLHFARQSSQESDIDKWVIEHTIKTLTKKNANIRFFINLSESSLKDINFIEWLEKHHAQQIENLVFEIPEDTVLQWQSEAIHFIQQIKTHGGAVCIDQFGNHPESKAQIDAMHADFYKIDGAFINNLSTNRKHQSIVHKICHESANSDTKTIANYVQDADSLAILWQEGVDFIQGNYLQEPEAHLDFKFESQI